MSLRRIDVEPPLVEGVAPGAVPKLDWVRIVDLVIDDRYQRPLTDTNWRRIRAIASAFQWAKFSPLVVAPIEGGTFAVIDGQHRAHAALLCGIAAVPALVVDISAGDQAQAFVGINTVTLRVSKQAMFKAALAAGEAWAVALDSAVAAAGCSVGTYAPSARDKKAYVIYAADPVRKAVDSGFGPAATAALTALRTYDTMGRPALWSDYVLRPWINAFATSIFMPADVTAPRLLAVLERRDPFKVIESAGMDAQQSRSEGAIRIWRAMLRDVIRGGAQ